MSLIFFGWLLVFLHLKINGFDILPDFIGYALIFAGANKLSVKSPYFSETRIFAVIMCIVSFSGLLHLETVTVESDSLFMLLMMLLSVLMMLIPLYMMYLITRGMGDLEWETASYLDVDTLMRVWKFDVMAILLLCVASVLSILLLNILAELWIVVAILTICVLVANLAWVICFYKCWKRYDAAAYGISLEQPAVHTKSVLAALAVCMMICGMTAASYSEYAEVMRGGIAYVENVCYEDYEFIENATKDSDCVVIDWNHVQEAIGQDVYSDGKCRIYISDIQSDYNGGYKIFFKTAGDFGYEKGRLVTPLSHMEEINWNKGLALKNIHQNWQNDAILQVTIGDRTYLSGKWCARAQSVDKNGDEAGYPLFSSKYYESGELVLIDEIRENNNQVTIRLIGLRDLTYERM